MALHIALDDTSDCGNRHLIQELVEFFTTKEYNVRTVEPLLLNPVLSISEGYNLSTSESALLTALDRSITWNSTDFSDFDLVFWQDSILSSYIRYTDDNVRPSFIQAVNRYFPTLDLYIFIEDSLDTKFENIIRQHKNLIKITASINDSDGLGEKIIEANFQKLPTCKWCGRLFTKTSSNKKYCSNNCKLYAKEEQNRDNFRNYYNRYKDTMSEAKKGALGSKGANLHGRANKDPEVEARLISNEKMRLGL